MERDRPLTLDAPDPVGVRFPAATEGAEEETMPAFDIADCINETCPWSGKPVQPDSLTEYDGQVVGFCNTGCRDKFERAIRHFDEAKASRDKRSS